MPAKPWTKRAVVAETFGIPPVIVYAMKAKGGAAIGELLRQKKVTTGKQGITVDQLIEKRGAPGIRDPEALRVVDAKLAACRPTGRVGEVTREGRRPGRGDADVEPTGSAIVMFLPLLDPRFA
jgi:hypothetical protein